jgi:predicted kinase
MLKFIMMSGPSGSGKSTVVREMMRKDPNLVRLNRDDLRAMSIDRWMPSKERWIIDSEVALARVACQLRKNVVIDDTNLMDKDAIKWEAVASEFPNYLFSKQLITASIKECVERDSKRVGKARVGGAVIERQFLRAKLWNVPPGKKICIFDIDGTMADLEHRIPWITIGAPCPNCSLQGRPDYVSTGFGDVPPGFNSFENGNWICKYCGCPGDNFCDEDKRRLSKKFHDMFYSLCNYDAPIEIVIKWIQACYDEFYVLIVSGRSPENGTYEATVKWLEDNRN